MPARLLALQPKLRSSPKSSGKLRPDLWLRKLREKQELEGAGHVTRAPAGDVTADSRQLRAPPAQC